MPCPICDQKPANCDCTEEEKRQYAQIGDLQDEIERLRLTVAEREAVEFAANRLMSAYVEERQIALTLRSLLARSTTSTT